ncbi:geranylgeranylglyceryl/heptaprenylglyceryl phosphate synthase [Neptunitalea lumnitzerae]|uniref:Geranylgeranylglyceryl phosphate synthase n=1 Tax=Neptunitalea lumnitzerae TaxID=2965509 RepID=A0ABQ5MGD4_9FLAO|nr:geranylgeranylglyceryl/heptaprenylglyceryl phosphate synthase [Neptunitalea sp. Y10]GLB48427.1 geranylgeranylglyceryl phosphate synthase [Neptunitalea sp. Y10]
MSYYHTIVNAKASGAPLIAVLIDPDKLTLAEVPAFMNKVSQTAIAVILVGGSTVAAGITEPLVAAIKQHTTKPVVLFPGDVGQLTNKADGLLFLMLLSGRNPEYLIDQQVASVPFLREASLEVVSTGYILLDGGKETATMQVTHTTPIPFTEINRIKDTAKAGEFMGNKLMYLEAGSGALHPVPVEVIREVKQDLTIPIIVGGGIRTEKALLDTIKSGADMIVIGTAFEEDETFFEVLQNITIAK